MNSFNTYIVPFILAAGLHALVVAALILKWEDSERYEVTRIEPLYIDASLVKENPFKAKERQAKAAQEQVRRQRDEERRADEREAQLEKARLAEAARENAAKAAKEKSDKKQEVAQSTKAKPVPPQPAQNTAHVEEEARLKMEQSLALAILDEQEYRRAVTDDEKAMAYVAQIQREIIQNWSRPPSARNGMQALLKVTLVPTGEVVDVTIIKSSGNDAFDRSATLAVKKAQRFEVPPDARQFERNFRVFEVLFRPEDLRL